MMQNDWLGYYWDGNDDPHDGAMHLLRLFISPSNVLCFEYYEESRSNHGYDIAFQEGTVRSVGDSELVVDVTCRYENGWEDWFKEDRLDIQTTPQVRAIKVTSIRENKPILSYNGVELWFKSTDSVADAARVASLRAEIDRLSKQRETPDA